MTTEAIIQISTDAKYCICFIATCIAIASIIIEVIKTIKHDNEQ